MKRSRVNPRSKKRAAEMERRYELYDVVRREQGRRCAWPGCTRQWDDLHEVLTRARGGSHIDRPNIIGLCRAHNGEATNTRPAECLGVVIPSWAARDLTAALTQAETVRRSIGMGDPCPCPWRRAGEPCTSPNTVQAERCEQAQDML